MNIFKLIGVIAVIGIGLWASTVHAENLRSRTVHLECVPDSGFFCGPGGLKGELSIQRWEMGANKNQSGFIPSDGDPHPFLQLNVLLQCQAAHTGGESMGPRQFYVLYITPSSLGIPIRIITFNPFCESFRDRAGGRLPDIGDPNLWFTDNLLVKVVLEADDDDFLHGNDSLSVDVLIGVAQQPPVAGCISPPSGLVSWWPGDGNALDIVGPNDGTLFNGATFAPGLVGPAFSFDGVDDTMDFPETAITSDLQELTVDAWVRHDSLPVQIQRYITLGGPQEVVLRHNGSGQLHFFLRIGGVLHHVQVNGVLQVGVFHHVAGTFDGSIMRLYLDGVEVGSLAVSGTIAPPTFGFLSSSGESLDGLLDEVQFFDRALTAPEIAAIFAAGAAGKCK